MTETVTEVLYTPLYDRHVALGAAVEHGQAAVRVGHLRRELGGDLEGADRPVDLVQLRQRLPEVDVRAIRKRQFKVAIDCVRGAGGLIIPQLLERLHCVVSAINLEADGRFRFQRKRQGKAGLVRSFGV